MPGCRQYLGHFVFQSERLKVCKNNREMRKCCIQLMLFGTEQEEQGLRGNEHEQGMVRTE